MRNTGFFMLILWSSVFTACEKKEDKPEMTVPTGVVACKFDGIPWSSEKRDKQVFFEGRYVPATGAVLKGDTLTLMAFNTVIGDSSMIYMKVLLRDERTGNYTMEGIDHNIYFFPSLNPAIMMTLRYMYNTRSALSITRFDTTGHKISGTFSTTHTSQSPGHEIRITDGVFTDVYLE